MKGRKPKPAAIQIAEGDPAKRGVHKLRERLAAEPDARRTWNRKVQSRTWPLQLFRYPDLQITTGIRDRLSALQGSVRVTKWLWKQNHPDLKEMHE